MLKAQRCCAYNSAVTMMNHMILCHLEPKKDITTFDVASTHLYPQNCSGDHSNPTKIPKLLLWLMDVYPDQDKKKFRLQNAENRWTTFIPWGDVHLRDVGCGKMDQCPFSGASAWNSPGREGGGYSITAWERGRMCLDIADWIYYKIIIVDQSIFCINDKKKEYIWPHYEDYCICKY